MKTLITLALMALAFTFLAFLLSAGTMPRRAASEPSRRHTLLDSLPPSRQAAAKPTPNPAQSARPRAAAAQPQLTLDPVLLEEYRTAIRSGDGCEMYNLKTRSYAYTPENAVALIEAIDPSPALREMLSPQGPLFASDKSDKKFQHRASRFVLALRLSGQIGVDTPNSSLEMNPAAARKLFLDLEAEEPGNGAYPFFRLVAENSLNLKPEELRATAEKALAASYFDTAVEDVTAEYYRAGWQSPALHQFIRTRSYLFASFGFHSAGDLLKKAIGPGNEPALAHFGRLMMEKGTRSSSPTSSYEYFSDQFDYGHGLAKDKSLRTIYELSAEREQRLNLPMENGLEIVNGVCQSKKFEEYFYAARGRH